MEINEILDGLNDSAGLGSSAMPTSSNSMKGDGLIKTLLLVSLLSNNNMGRCCDCCCEKPKFKKVKQTVYEPENGCGGANLFGGNNNMLLLLVLLGVLDR